MRFSFLGIFAIFGLIFPSAFAIPSQISCNDSTAQIKTKRQFDSQVLIDAFMEGLDSSNYDISSFDGNVSDLATRLVGWDGCNKRGMSAAVYSGWQQSWKLMNHVYSEAKGGIDFNSAAAIEFIGPPALSETFQPAINDKSPPECELMFVN